MNPYQYCTYCGEELDDVIKEKYKEQYEGGPVICRSCAFEIIQGIPKAFKPIFEMADEIINAWAKALSATDETEEQK
jgi:hypothetical protein